MILIENYFSILQIFLFHYSFIFDNRKKKHDYYFFYFPLNRKRYIYNLAQVI